MVGTPKIERHEDLLKAIEAGQFSSLDSAERVGLMIRHLAAAWSSAHTANYMDGVDGAPSWMEYEHKIWQMGESLRPLLKKRKKWHGKGEVMDAVAEILSDERFGKGRQTFALLLGDFGASSYGSALAAQLRSEEVQGHCLKSLRKAKIYGYDKEVGEVYRKRSGWVKKAAKAYLEMK